MRTLIAVLATAMPAVGQDAEGWRPLFNGKDLEGWDTWLGKPHKGIDVPGLRKNEKGDYTEAVGLNKDPKGVYSVVEVDGAPAIRISGEVWGALTSKEEFENYHLSWEFKWGTTKWPPRDKAVRDSGLLYHCVGNHGAQSGFWMRSGEIQIQEKDCGDFHSVAGVLIDVEAERKNPSDPKSPWVYKRGAPLQKGLATRIIKDADHEKPSGQWNTMEVYCVGGTVVHLVNGKPNLVLTNHRHKVNGKEEPLTKGRIQFQSEGAEVFYRNIRIRPMAALPKDVVSP